MRNDEHHEARIGAEPLTIPDVRLQQLAALAQDNECGEVRAVFQGTLANGGGYLAVIERQMRELRDEREARPGVPPVGPPVTEVEVRYVREEGVCKGRSARAE